MSKDELYAPKRKARFTEEEKAKAARLIAHARGVRADRTQRYKVKTGRLTESRLQLAIASTARRMNFLVVKLRASGRRGVPDLLLITPRGRVSFMEVKIPGGRVAPSQVQFHRDLVEHGATVYVVYSLVEAIEKMQEESNRG